MPGAEPKFNDPSYMEFLTCLITSCTSARPGISPLPRACTTRASDWGRYGPTWTTYTMTPWTCPLPDYNFWWMFPRGTLGWAMMPPWISSGAPPEMKHPWTLRWRWTGYWRRVSGWACVLGNFGESHCGRTLSGELTAVCLPKEGQPPVACLSDLGRGGQNEAIEPTLRCSPKSSSILDQMYTYGWSVIDALQVLTSFLLMEGNANIWVVSIRVWLISSMYTLADGAGNPPITGRYAAFQRLLRSRCLCFQGKPWAHTWWGASIKWHP
jgi:hypothetical protein